jgi:hypothetical protein
MGDLGIQDLVVEYSSGGYAVRPINGLNLEAVAGRSCRATNRLPGHRQGHKDFRRRIHRKTPPGLNSSSAILGPGSTLSAAHTAAAVVSG